MSKEKPSIVKAAEKYKSLDKKRKEFQKQQAEEAKKKKEEKPSKRVVKTEVTHQPEDDQPIEVMDIKELEELIKNESLKNIDISDNITGSQIIERQLDLWKIKKDNLSYKVLMEIAVAFNSDKDGKVPTVDEIIDYAHEKFNKSKGTIISSLMTMIRKADFSDSPFIPVFASMPKSKITWQLLVSELADFA